MSLPVWRELKLYSGRTDGPPGVRCLNEPSRLKGMETHKGENTSTPFVCMSEWAFPFEGNGNELPGLQELLVPQESEWAFPFEGNGKHFGQALGTVQSGSEWAFPFEGNGNDKPTMRRHYEWGLNEPSRLKGMETTFSGGRVFCRCRVWMSLPVWREWKLFILFLLTLRCSVRSEWAFPFEGNGNFLHKQPEREISTSEWAFPFEGNGNEIWLFNSWIREIFSLNEPSRLKGMETYMFQDYPEGLEKSKCAFPFEGNWNPLFWIAYTGYAVLCCWGLNVPSRLKGMETYPLSVFLVVFLRV